MSEASRAVVGVVMGSDSDWPVMEAAAQALTEFDVPHEVDVVSAHRMPEEMLEYGRSAYDRGLRVIIAGAGGAAHLPGMLASVTPLPVIGVPVPLKHLDGLDSLLSIVQMPAGVPVATVSVGGARNAGLLAVRILGASDAALRGPDARLPGGAARRGQRQGGDAAAAARRDDRLRPDLTGRVRGGPAHGRSSRLRATPPARARCARRRCAAAATSGAARLGVEADVLRPLGEQEHGVCAAQRLVALST